MKRNAHPALAVLGVYFLFLGAVARPATNVYLTEVPDYAWFYGCMGTAAGNLMGFWDRHGFPDFYTGPVNGGVATLNNGGTNDGMTAMWVSVGHANDYYVDYESTNPDPYFTAGRPEHKPDCIGDFIGMDQLKWTNMAGECNGNLDGFCFVYWDTNGERRVNFTPTGPDGEPVPDVQSGLAAWTRWRGYDCTVFTQLTDFNPTVPAGHGFTFADMKAEIDAGYPVLLFLQGYGQLSRTVSGVPNMNPLIHSMLAYGYYLSGGVSYVRYRTSWNSGDNRLRAWTSQVWEIDLPVRGVICFHPLPKIRDCSLSEGNLTLRWDGPAADLYESMTGATRRVHGYVVEMSPSLTTPEYTAVSDTLTNNSFTVTNCPAPAFFRVRLTRL